jgi:hypothetical protein
MEYKLLNNKKAYSLAGWTETALFVTLFMLLIAMLITNLNVTLDEDYDSSFGAPDRLSDIQDRLSGYQDTLQQGVTEGKTTSSGDGLSWTKTWSIITAGADIMWRFLTGGFIEDVVNMIGLPVIFGEILRILFVLSIGFILIKLVLRVKP